MSAEPFLRLSGIVKTFPGVRALDGARLELRPGEVHAVVGENGAGKSTLMNIVAGVCRPDSGNILLDGEPVRFSNPQSANRHGIAVVFQELSLVPNLSIAENIFANRQPVDRLNRINWKDLHARTRKLLALFELQVSPQHLVKDLPVAAKQLVEVLKAMSHEPRILILDEPTSSLEAVETRLLFKNIRRLKSRGVSFIYISHHLPELFEISDRITILRDGRYVDTCETADVSEDKLIRKMVGRELQNIYGTRTQPVREPFFAVYGATSGNRFRDVSFGVRAGEIVGLAGLVGAGRTELARAILGAEPMDRGTISIDGTPVRIRSPRHAIANRIGYLTEDRKDQGLFLRMALRDNVAAPSLPRFVRKGGWIDDPLIDRFAEGQREAFRIAAPSVKQRVGNLSGGNQQKVLLSMWVGIKPRLLIADEPTRGVDIGAKSDIYALLRELTDRGTGILMISSDLQEILGLSDRILIMRNGRIVAERSRAEATEENIIAAASGVELT